MAALVKLTDAIWVAPSEISRVELNHERDVIYFRMKDGETVVVGRDYGQSIFATWDRLRRELQRAEQPAA